MKFINKNNCINVVARILTMLLICGLSGRSYAVEELSQSYDVKLAFNVLEPVCKLSSVDEKINFGEFDLVTMLTAPPEAQAVLFLNDCSGVKRVNLKFTGNYIDLPKNQLNIKQEEEGASGLAIKLYDKSRNEINLGKTKELNINGASSYTFTILAKLILINDKQPIIKPGRVTSAVTLEISYE
ncbi:fimbrial protein [Escherichia coli]|uniref:fimbrial protein n=2 Tax=Escherichia coli TaxID=562 RepID=UPI000BE17F52|nr:fimbrial protein [Escherichia coli]